MVPEKKNFNSVNVFWLSYRVTYEVVNCCLKKKIEAFVILILTRLDSSLDHPDVSSLDEQSRGLFGYSLAVFGESDLVLTFIKAFPDSGKTLMKSKPARFEVQAPK